MDVNNILCSHYIHEPFFYDGGLAWKNVSNSGLSEGYFYYFQIKDTIHYKALESWDFTLYKEYLMNQPGDHQPGHVEDRVKEFKALYENFDVNKIGTFEISPCFDTYVTVNDGVHRLAIMLHKGIITDTIPDEWLETKTDIIKRELKNTVGNMMYNGWHASRMPYGYHSFNLFGVQIRGQRSCLTRINEFRKYFNFAKKNVLDFGCNVGGMLMHLSECKTGLGVDYDIKAVTAASNIARTLGYKRFKFIQHDFDQDENHVLYENEYFLNFTPHVIFMLSIRGWVKNFSLMQYVCNKYKVPIFWEGHVDMDFFDGNEVDVKLIMPHSYDDITGNYDRTTYFIQYK